MGRGRRQLDRGQDPMLVVERTSDTTTRASDAAELSPADGRPTEGNPLALLDQKRLVRLADLRAFLRSRTGTLVLSGTFLDHLADAFQASGELTTFSWPRRADVFCEGSLTPEDRRWLSLAALVGRTTWAEDCIQMIQSCVEDNESYYTILAGILMRVRSAQHTPPFTDETLRRWAYAFLRGERIAQLLRRGRTPTELTTIAGSRAFAHWLLHPCGGRRDSQSYLDREEASPSEIRAIAKERIRATDQARQERTQRWWAREKEQEAAARVWASQLLEKLRSGGFVDADDLGMARRSSYDGKLELPRPYPEAIRRLLREQRLTEGPFAAVPLEELTASVVSFLLVGGYQQATRTRLAEIISWDLETLTDFARTPFQGLSNGPRRLKARYLDEQFEEFLRFFARGEYMHRILSSCPKETTVPNLQKFTFVRPSPYAFWATHPLGGLRLPEESRLQATTWQDAARWAVERTRSSDRTTAVPARPLQPLAAPYFASSGDVRRGPQQAVETLGCSLERVNVDLISANPAKQREVFDRVQHVILFGGPDIPREWYESQSGLSEEQAATGTGTDRDRVERRFTEWALAESKPLHAICRGMQLLNVVAGGSLWPELRDGIPTADAPGHRTGRHRVRIDPESGLGRRLQAALGDSPIDRDPDGNLEIEVVSSHHQCIRTVAPGFRPVAWSPDGVIEAIEHEEFPDRYWGVQFHPERDLSNPAARALTEAILGVDSAGAEK